MEELLADATLSHYRIVSKSGVGGMGKMYLAPDTSELGRHAPAQAAVRDLLEHVLDGLRKAGLDVPVLT